jgi:hypothetical protein
MLTSLQAALVICGVTFWKNASKTKIADNSGALLWPKSFLFVAIYKKKPADS